MYNVIICQEKGEMDMNFAKRTVTALTAAAVCLMGIPAVMPELADTVVMTASAEDGLTYGNLSYRVEDSGTITITGCDRSVAEVIIPAEIDGKVVTSIGDGAFSVCINLTSITIPKDVTVICDYAFYGCTNLTSVTIPEGVTKIGAFVFENCTSLTSITIPESVTVIGERTFFDCTNLTSVTIPEGVTEIGYGA
ncbi:MAG: leucine-rich repeat domain-containing protein, partial [Oscillospiraceae bacterium]|nr:leucine-rich repeat domain-containing protein [Oscillospiraceae bacterium]